MHVPLLDVRTPYIYYKYIRTYIVQFSILILLQDDESHFDQLKDVGMKIIEKCDGLPLAIKVMGGLLSTRHPSEREWEIVLNKNLEWEEHGSQEELNYSVHLSYDDRSIE